MESTSQSGCVGPIARNRRRDGTEVLRIARERNAMTSTPEGPPPERPTGRAATPLPALFSLLARGMGDPESRATLAGGAVAVGLLGAIFWKNLAHFGISWATDENYSHGFLVPLIALYFANLAAERGPVAVRGGGALGPALLFSALLVKLATVIVVVGTLGDLAFIVAIAGVVALLAGTAALRRYGFAIAFLVFMIPLPVALYAAIASPLQLLVSRVASVVLNATGVPVLTEGNMMTLPGGVQMFVAEACSGMRQLTGFLALTAAVAYLSGRPLWYRAAVVGSAVPIAMTANMARVVLTGYIMYFVNPEYASGTYHTLEGLLMLGFGLSLLRGGCWVLDQVLAATTADGEVAATCAPAPGAGRPGPSHARGDAGVMAAPSASAGG
jgi:exosortase